MEKETAEMYIHRRDEWLKQKKILDANEPKFPSLRLDHTVVAVLDDIDGDGIWIKYANDDGVDHDRYAMHLEKRSAIDLAHFIIELFGDKYSPD